MTNHNAINKLGKAHKATNKFQLANRKWGVSNRKCNGITPQAIARNKNI